MKKVINNLDRILAALAVLATAGYIISVIIQIFSRTFLPKAPSWTEEMGRYFFVYAVALSAGLAVRTNAYVAVDIFTSKIPEKLKHYYHVALNVFLMLFSLYFLCYSVLKFTFLKARLVSAALEIPMQYIYFSMVILFGMLTVSYLFETMLVKFYGKKTEEGVSLT